MRSLVLLALALLSAGCVAHRAELPLGQWFRVGVDAEREAAALSEGLERAGYRRATRLEGEGFVALGFVRDADDRRAVRVVTRLGVVVALDSHETDGVRVRHGAVRLVERRDHDWDGDGRPEIGVLREDPAGDCLAVLRIGADGRATAVEVEAELVAPGSCASEVVDVDGDARVELMVMLAWPMLALGEEPPALGVPLVAQNGGWRADGLPSAFAQREAARVEAALATARRELDPVAASRLGVLAAALANLAGAPRATQVRRYDEAMHGLVLRPDERDRVLAIRAYIASGFRARDE